MKRLFGWQVWHIITSAEPQLDNLMLIGRSLLVTIALLAYMGQSVAYAQSVCSGMSDSSVDAVSAMMLDSDHMHHEMASQGEEPDYDDCSDRDCQCPNEGCHSPVPALSASNDALIFSEPSRGEQQSRRIVRTLFYLYKPPIFS